MFRGDLQRSRALHTQAMNRALPPEQRHQMFCSLGGLAELAMVEGDYVNAQRLAEECLALCRQKNNPVETAWPLTCLGEIATRRGDFAAAHTGLGRGADIGSKSELLLACRDRARRLGGSSRGRGQARRGAEVVSGKPCRSCCSEASWRTLKGRCGWRAWPALWVNTRSPPRC